MDDGIHACQSKGGSQKPEAEANPITTPSSGIDEGSPDILCAGLFASCEKCDEDDEEKKAAYKLVRCRKEVAQENIHVQDASQSLEYRKESFSQCVS